MKFCDQPWTTFTITADGSMVPCLCGIWNTVGPIGNVINQDLNEILQSQKLKSFKETILDQSFGNCTNICPHLPILPNVDTIEKDSEQLFLPTHLLLGIDQNCNLRCESCRSENIFSKTRNKNADIILEKIQTTFANQQVTLQCDGYGDVFASESYKNFFANIDKNFNLHIITNGNLITKNQNLIEKLSNQILSVDVSIDAATPDTYSNTRGGVFDKVIDGIKLLVEQKIKVNLSFVVQEKNYTEVMPAYELAVNLGCHSINFHKLEKWSHMTDSWWNRNKLDDNPSVDLSSLKKNFEYFKTLPKQVVWGESIPVYMTGNLYNL
jgi:radical SAM protein with 4Fe4S-binding SPASM domain